VVGDVREQVRRRYAAAADAATGGGRTSLEVLDECGPGCCTIRSCAPGRQVSVAYQAA
jgi:hypothetical protein